MAERHLIPSNGYHMPREDQQDPDHHLIPTWGYLEPADLLTGDPLRAENQTATFRVTVTVVVEA